MTDIDCLANLDPEFATIVGPLLQNADVLSMNDYRHHDRTALTHSLGVSKKAYSIAKRLRLDASSVARGALLHDFFLYDWRDGNNPKHPSNHARIALANATKRFRLNRIEEDIIMAHMWPVCRPFYSYTESALVSMVDKLVSTREVLLLLRRSLAGLVHRRTNRRLMQVS